jgi:GWxTD domain-containing protein
LEDLNRKRKGLLNIIKGRAARSEAAGDWEVAPPDPGGAGLHVADPLFLSNAPFAHWGAQESMQVDPEESPLFSYLHPNRRYGLEQDRLQVFFEVTAAHPEQARPAASHGLLVQVLAKDLDFALRDTISFAEPSLVSLAASGTAGIYYELDVNQLPSGAYQLSCAPASGQGRGWVAEFDVIWNLDVLNRHGDELEGEARTVLLGDRIKDFLDAGQAEREIILEDFWANLDPDPSTPLNEAYLEFRRRISYVDQRLGGFGRTGAKDARGEVYLLLGPPNEIQVESLPLNAADLEDATVRVWDKYAPVRAGTEAKGARPGGTQGRAGKEAKGTQGGIPLEQSYESRRELASKQRQIGRENAFELWKYNHSGNQLFTNKYSGGTLGLRFLFVDRTGTGHYVLESTNVWKVGN